MIKKSFKILIIGGSQGAEFFDNEISELMISLYKNYEISIVQQITTKNKIELIKEKYSMKLVYKMNYLILMKKYI